MKTIYKYQLEITDEQEVALPLGAQILSVQMQNGILCLWAFVDSEAYPIARTIRVFGTGNPFPELGTHQHLGTVQQPPCVWHVFEKKR